MVFVCKVGSVKDKLAICDMLKNIQVEYTVKAKGVNIFKRIPPSGKIAWFNIYVKRKDVEKARAYLMKAGYSTNRYNP